MRPRARGTALAWRTALTITAVLLLVIGPAASAPLGDRPSLRRPPGWFDAHVYHHYSDMTTELQDLASQHGDSMSLDSIGSSVRGRELWCARMEDASVEGAKLDLYYDGGHHGNEYLGTELGMLLVHHLLEDTDDPLVGEVLSRSVVWVTPMVNPDGNARDQRDNVNGVDLNRNYPFSFTPGGSHGDSPASEPETRANVGFMEGTGLDLYITGHTGTRALIYPWGDREEACPDAPMYERFRGIAEAAGVSYGPSGTTLYISQGTSEDFAYGALGSPAFTFEVDGQQTNQITRREDIAVRLADELELTMQLLASAPLMTANLTVRGVEVPAEANAGEPTEVRVELENPTYTPANNTSVAVHVTQGRELTDSADAVVDVPEEGCATVVLRVTVPKGGLYDVSVTVNYPRLLWENASIGISSYGPVPLEVRGGLFGGGASGGAVVLLLLLLACAAGAYIAWRRGLLGRLPVIGALRNRPA